MERRLALLLGMLDWTWTTSCRCHPIWLFVTTSPELPHHLVVLAAGHVPCLVRDARLPEEVNVHEAAPAV